MKTEIYTWRVDDAAGQSKLQAQAAKSIGKIAGENPLRAESARVLIREDLAREYDRRLSH